MNTFLYIGAAAILISLLILLGILIGHRRHKQQLPPEQPTRREHDSDTEDEHSHMYDIDCGPPGCSRGKVWSNNDRDKHRQRQRNITIRITDHNY